MRPGADVDDSYGVIEFGSCGFTHSDGTLAYPKDTYAALAGVLHFWQFLASADDSQLVKGLPVSQKFHVYL